MTNEDGVNYGGARRGSLAFPRSAMAALPNFMPLNGDSSRVDPHFS